MWNKRFTVLCGSRMFIFSGSQPKGKPNLVLDLKGGRIDEHKSKKHFYCVQVTASHRVVRLAFESGLAQSKWLERAAKVKIYGNFAYYYCTSFCGSLNLIWLVLRED